MCMCVCVCVCVCVCMCVCVYVCVCVLGSGVGDVCDDGYRNPHVSFPVFFFSAIGFLMSLESIAFLMSCLCTGSSCQLFLFAFPFCFSPLACCGAS